MAKRIVEIDDETQVVVPRVLPSEALKVMRGAMPVEVRYWQEGGRLHAAFLEEKDCVSPQSVWDAALASLDRLTEHTVSTELET